MRPTPEDRQALHLLLQREDVSDFNAEFLETLRNWQGHWTEKQARYFSQLCVEYFGEA